MSKRKKNTVKRFTDEYKSSKTSYMNTLLMRVIHRTNNGKAFTIFMISNWIWSKNENAILDEVFEALMREVDPEGLEADKKKLAEMNVPELV